MRYLVIAVSLVLLLGALLSTGGCQVAGAAAYFLQPPAKSEAKYVPTTRPMAVFVDAERQAGNAGSVHDSVAALVVQELREHKLSNVLDSEKIYDLRTANSRKFRSMKVDEVGKAVGAEQVVYVDVINADLITTSGGQLMKAKMQAYVRVVDVPTGRTLWPTNANDGYPLLLETPYRGGDETNMDLLKQEMIRSMAGAVAKLFYTYTLDE